MKTIVITLLTFIFSQTTYSNESKTYFHANYGVGKFSSDKLDNLDAKPSGKTIGLGFGARVSYIEIGAFFKNFDYSVDITHDGVANKIIHKGKSFGPELNIFLNNHLSLNFGYAFNLYKQTLGTSVTTTQLASINDLYGIEDDHSSSGLFYGAGFNWFGSKRFDITTSIISLPMGDGKSATSVQAGFVLYMDGSFTDFFGAN